MKRSRMAVLLMAVLVDMMGFGIVIPVLPFYALELGATALQVALAWLFGRSPAILNIPGTSRVAHLEENVAAASLRLSEDEMRELDGQA